jgi:hypothetical protein
VGEVLFLVSKVGVVYMKNQKEYQEVLRTITAVERYINPRSVILHHYSKCGQDFYAKPIWLVGKYSQLPIIASSIRLDKIVVIV